MSTETAKKAGCAVVLAVAATGVWMAYKAVRPSRRPPQRVCVEDIDQTVFLYPSRRWAKIVSSGKNCFGPVYDIGPAKWVVTESDGDRPAEFAVWPEEVGGKISDIIVTDNKNQSIPALRGHRLRFWVKPGDSLIFRIIE